MNVVAGVDVGGSAAKIGLVAADGRIVARRRVAIAGLRDFAALEAALAEAMHGLWAEAGVASTPVGLGHPGYVAPETGLVSGGADNLPLLKGRSLAQALRERLGVPVLADNDGACAVAGELAFGTGRRMRHFLLLTLGTGVGGGIVVDGRMVRGSGRAPSEIGHVSLDPHGPPCHCGSRGCLENYASAPALVSDYRARMESADEPLPVELAPEAVFARAGAGDAAARAAVEAMAEHIAHAAGMVQNVVRLEACVLGGGVAAAGEALLAPVRRHLPRYVYPVRREGLRVEASALGNDAGLLGAAALVR